MTVSCNKQDVKFFTVHICYCYILQKICDKKVYKGSTVHYIHCPDILWQLAFESRRLWQVNNCSSYGCIFVYS